MRIIACKPSTSTRELLGLNESVAFRRLGPIVALAGPNGSGKSRLLSAVERAAHCAPNRHEAREKARQDLATFGDAVRDIDGGGRLNEAHRRTEFLTYARHAEEQLEELAQLELEGDPPKLRLIKFVPRGDALKDPATMPKMEVLDKAQKLVELALPDMRDSALSYLQALQDRHFTATHPNFVLSDSSKLEI